MKRRDFMNGLMLAAGGAVFGGCAHQLKQITQGSMSPGLGPAASSALGSSSSIDSDPRALRGGNLPSVFAVGHWMRDGRLEFQKDSVKILPGPGNPEGGTHPIFEENTRSTQNSTTRYDVIILGTGISGLSSAFYLSRKNPKIRILFLEANAFMGGSASQDTQSPLPFAASTGAAYGVLPYASYLKEIYKETGVDWESHIIPDPFYNYFFDDRTPFVNKGTRGWFRDVYGKGLGHLPYSPEILSNLKDSKQDFMRWYNTEGGPTDPADKSDPKYDYLAGMTLQDYLVKKKGYHPAVSDFYTRFTIDALAGTTSQVSAYSGISFLGAEYSPVFAFPGGNAAIAKHFLQWLIPPHQELDSPTGRVRMRQSAIALRVDTDNKGASVTYYREGKFHRASAKTVVVSTLSHSAQHLVAHLLDPATKKAWKGITLVPVAVANVTLKSAAPLVDLELGFNQYWWGSKFWADFVTADWVGKDRMKRDRPTVLTFYGGNTAPPEEIPAERMALMTRPFSEYEDSLRDDLSRILAGSGFDFDRDVSGIYLYRWGHGMVYPKPGYVYPVKSGNLEAGSHPVSDQRGSAARHLARKPIGNIFFAGQDTEGAPSIECAIASGVRVADDVATRSM